MRKREVRSAPTRSPDVIFVTIPSRCHTTTCVMASITVSNQSGLFTSNTAFTSLRLSSIFPSLSRQQTELFITYSAFTSQQPPSILFRNARHEHAHAHGQTQMRNCTVLYLKERNGQFACPNDPWKKLLCFMEEARNSNSVACFVYQQSSNKVETVTPRGFGKALGTADEAAKHGVFLLEERAVRRISTHVFDY